MTLIVKDAAGTNRYLQTAGLGTLDDPFLVLNGDYMLEASRGNIPGTSTVHKFGLASSIDTGDGVVDVWDGVDDTLGTGKIPSYTFSTSADITLISSTSAADTQVVSVQGLDANWDLVEQEVTLTGQTAATLTTALIRVFRVYNAGSVDFAGNIFICTTGTTFTAGVPQTAANVRAVVKDGDNQTQMAIYTVPRNHTLYITHGWSNLSKPATTEAVVQIFRRPFESVFRVLHTLALQTSGTSSEHRPYMVPLRIPEKTDIVYRAQVYSSASAVSAGFHGILVEEIV